MTRHPAPADGERIVRAAIRVGHAVYSVPPPGRHGDVFALDKATHQCAPEDQGFLTSTGRFVERDEALTIAAAAGQIIVKTGPADILFSEDVW